MSLALVDRVLAGDAEALGHLLRASWPRLGTTLARGSGAIERAELEQEATRVLVETARQIREQSTRDGQAVPADADFAAAAVVNMRRRITAILSAERRRRARLRPLDDVESVPGADLRTRFSDEVESPRLAAALARLSPRMRAIIAGVYWREATDAQLAAETGVRTATVRQIRRRAELSLRRQLGVDARPRRR